MVKLLLEIRHSRWRSWADLSRIIDEQFEYKIICTSVDITETEYKSSTAGTFSYPKLQCLVYGTTNLTFKRSLSRICFCFASDTSSGMSQVTFMYRPLSHSRRSFVKYTTLSAQSSAVSTYASRIPSGRSLAAPTMSVGTLPGWMLNAMRPSSICSFATNSVKRTRASLDV